VIISNVRKFLETGPWAERKYCKELVLEFERTGIQFRDSDRLYPSSHFLNIYRVRQLIVPPLGEIGIRGIDQLLSALGELPPEEEIALSTASNGSWAIAVFVAAQKSAIVAVICWRVGEINSMNTL
jgi:hypothetical protein